MNRHIGINSFSLAVFFLSTTALLSPVNADPVLGLTVGPLMGATSMDLMGGVDNGDGSFDFAGEESMMGMWDLTYDMVVDEDPFVNAAFSFKNTSTMTQSFILNVTLLITPPVVPSSLIGGSIGGSLTDANFDGSATLGTVMGSPMYNGEIDGAGVLSIFPDATSFTANAFPGQTINIPATNVGLPGPTIPGSAVNSSIGITHTFTLTPGDTVAFTSFFVVEPIPEPASLGLMGLVCGGLYFKRKFFPVV